MRTELLTFLERYQPHDDKERADVEQMRVFAATLENPFARTELTAHFTGSALVVHPDGARTCFVHHRKLGRWLQPGGHHEPGDGGSLERTALREAAEETGMRVRLHVRAPRPLDVDVHVIPARGGEPEHRHLDVRFLVVAESPEAMNVDPSESRAIAWLTWEEALARADEPALVRLIQKGKSFGAG